MKKVDIIRAWKDESYRNSLSAEQISQLPANPAGNLNEEEQSMVTGGGRSVMQTHTCGLRVCDES